MTTSHILNAVSPLIADLAQDLSERERLRRLLAALRNLLPADAVALLKLEGEWLHPMAIDGLMPDTLGRRFRLAEHPRFAQLLAAGQAIAVDNLIHDDALEGVGQAIDRDQQQYGRRQSAAAALFLFHKALLPVTIGRRNRRP